MRPRGTPLNRFQFGQQTVETKVNVMVPRQPVRAEYVDVAALIEDRGGRSMSLDILTAIHDGEDGR